MEIVFNGVHNGNPGGVKLTKFENGLTLSTVKVPFAPWYGIYETALIKNGEFFILKGYDTLEEAISGHEKFTKMSEKELTEYDYIG